MRRTRHGYMPTLQRKVTRDHTGPVCLTCLKPVDSEELVEGYPGEPQNGQTHCKLLVKCHGAEELATFEFDTSDWDVEDLYRAVARTRFFDPVADGAVEP